MKQCSGESEMRLGAVEAASAFIEAHFPEAGVAIVGGSLIRGEGTSTSDLDIVIVADRDDAPFRASYRFETRPIEAFVHTERSLPEWMATDSARGRPSLAMMCAEGVIVRNVGGAAELVKEQAQNLLQRGPKPLTQKELEDWRYSLTDLLDDFLGSDRFDEGMFIADALATEAADLLLLMNARWRGAGKWVPRALRRYSPDAANRLTDALQSYYREQNKEPLVRFAEDVLQQAGGRLFEGYYRTAKHSE